MKIVILGSGSFAGQALFSHYSKIGYSVIGINRSSPRDAAQWPWTLELNPESTWHNLNIIDNQIKNKFV